MSAQFPRLAGAVILVVGLAMAPASDQPTGAGRSTARANIRELIKAEEQRKTAVGTDAIARTAQHLAFARSLVGDYLGAIAAFRQQDESPPGVASREF